MAGCLQLDDPSTTTELSSILSLHVRHKSLILDRPLGEACLEITELLGMRTADDQGNLYIFLMRRTY
jgi:hypothetical protein